MRRRRRLRDVVLLASGASGFAATAVLASGGRVSERERAIFHTANDLSRLPHGAVWAPMQYGTFGTVIVVAGLALVTKRPRLAAGLLLGGTSAYVLAKATKRAVGRGRPVSELQEGDLGFPSRACGGVSGADVRRPPVRLDSRPGAREGAGRIRLVREGLRGSAPPARRRRRRLPGRRRRIGGEPGVRPRRPSVGLTREQAPSTLPHNVDAPA
jgi:hypothetical protein